MTGGDTKDDELRTDMHKWHGGIQMLYMKSCIPSCDGEMGSPSVYINVANGPIMVQLSCSLIC